MKKIIALALALVMLAAMAVPAFAADETQILERAEAVVEAVNENKAETITLDGSSNPTIQVKYGVDQCYTVTIIADINFNESLAPDSKDLKVDNLKLAGDEQMTITANSTNTWKLVDANGSSADVPYAMYTGAEASKKMVAGKLASEDSTVATATNVVLLKVYRPDANKGTDPVGKSTTVWFETDGTAQEGWYLDTITFTVEIIKDTDVDGAAIDATKDYSETIQVVGG